jgi:hypothetical protein
MLTLVVKHQVVAREKPAIPLQSVGFRRIQVIEFARFWRYGVKSLGFFRGVRFPLSPAAEM